MEDTQTAATEPTEKKSESFEPRTTDGFIGRVCKIESKRGIIMCLTTIVLAILFIVLALTSKIGMMDYSLSVPVVSTDNESGEITTEYSEHYSVDMSIFRLVYLAFGSMNNMTDYDEEGNEIKKEESELDKEVIKVQAAAQEEFDKWLATHEKASAEEQQRKRSEVFVKHYEEAGVFNTKDNIFFYENINHNSALSGHVILMFITMMLFLAATAVIVGGSFVCAVMALLKMKKKMQTHIVLRMLMLTFISSTITTVLLAASAMLAVSAGMLAIAILSGIFWLLLSNALAFMYGKDSVITIVKYDIMAALTFLAIFLLIAPAFSVTITADGKSIVYGGGIGITHVLDYYNNLGVEKASAVSQSVIWFLALGGLTAVLGFNAIVNRIGNGEVVCKNSISKIFNSRKVFIIATLVMFVMMIVFKFVFADKTGKSLETYVALGACLYLSLAAAAIALILDFVFKPEKKKLGAKTVESYNLN